MATLLRIVRQVRRARLGLFVLVLLAAPAAQAGDLVKVTLINGDTFVAQREDRSDERRLWLRFVGDGPQALRFVFWGDVSAVDKVVITPAATRVKSKPLLSNDIHAVAAMPARAK